MIRRQQKTLSILSSILMLWLSLVGVTVSHAMQLPASNAPDMPCHQTAHSQPPAEPLFIFKMCADMQQGQSCHCCDMHGAFALGTIHADIPVSPMQAILGDSLRDQGVITRHANPPYRPPRNHFS